MVLVDPGGGQHDERPEQATDHLYVRHLVGVVPIAPHAIDDEPVRVALAGTDGVLRHAGDAVRGIRDVDAVPVQRDAVRHVVVDDVHLDELPDPRGDGGTRGPAVERVAIDGVARREIDLAAFGGQLDLDVGHPLRILDKVGHARRVGAMMAAVVSRDAAGVDVAHVHDGVRRRDQAGVPQPRKRRHDDQRGQRRDQEPAAPQRSRARSTGSSPHRVWPLWRFWRPSARNRTG